MTKVAGTTDHPTGPDQVDVLAFANQSSARKGEVVQVYRNQVALRMVEQEEKWLVDCLITTAGYRDN